MTCWCGAAVTEVEPNVWVDDTGDSKCPGGGTWHIPQFDAPSSPGAHIMTIDMTPRALPPAFEATKAVQGPLRRFRAAETRLAAAQANYAETRREVVRELVAQGLSYAQIAGLIGVSRGRVFQIAKENPPGSKGTKRGSA